MTKILLQYLDPVARQRLQTSHESRWSRISEEEENQLHR
ncbi:hypothetical protein ACP70R_024128 [Stipagrostis hirtigluma subsp. patula]